MLKDILFAEQESKGGYRKGKEIIEKESRVETQRRKERNRKAGRTWGADTSRLQTGRTKPKDKLVFQKIAPKELTN